MAELLNSPYPQTCPRILDGKFFKIATVDQRGNVAAICLTCFPDSSVPDPTQKRRQEIHGYLKSTSNFTTHLKRKHAEVFKMYEVYVKDPEVQKKRIKHKIMDIPRPCGSTSKDRTEYLIMNYITESMSALSTVDCPAFIKLVTGLNPDARVISSSTLKARLEARYFNAKTELKQRLEKVEYVCVTTDIWSSAKHNFLGATCHWIDESLNRHSTLLSLRRFKGSNTNGKIAEILHEIFFSYGLLEKIICVVTDNGSNFDKAFKDYGCSVQNFDEDRENYEIEVFEMKPNAEGLLLDGFLLPEHYHCSSNTFSLIATADVEKAIVSCDGLGPISCKTILSAALGKCRTLWNKSSQSPQVDEIILERCGKNLIRPSATQWNSLFESIRSLLEFKEILPQLFEFFEVQNLDPLEVEFLEDYCTAMQPVAFALERLQSEKNYFFGYFAPIVLQTRKRLENIIAGHGSSKYTVPLTRALMNGIQHRFRAIWDLNIETGKNFILAAATHPYFKLRWLPESRVEEIKTLFLTEAEHFDKPTILGLSQKDFEDDNARKDDTFFEYETEEVAPTTSGSEEVVSRCKLECLQFLYDETKDLYMLNRYPTVKAMFIRFNTALPSSAPVQQLFNYDERMILESKKAHLLSDELFELLVFLNLYPTCNY